MNREEQKNYAMQQMGISENKLAAAFPEFETIKNRFLYGEVRQHGELTVKQRMLITVAVLVTMEGDDLEEQLRSALKQDVSPVELQEVFHQAAPYIGFSKAEKGLAVLKRVFEEENISLPLEPQSSVTEETRLGKGIAAQKSLFGPIIDSMRANAPEEQKFMQDYLSAYCFGDTYTRSGLDLKTRELLTFVCIISLGGCDSQAKSHVMGNLVAGNSPTLLLAAAAQCLPYIGFPRTLNAISAINETLKMQEQMKNQK
ncbi:MAG: carboxymuconolactone decarboxylase family protein [Clostridia bacterium]|jgi:4-carboxymuconolactone decarboxylase|nr:carboxymuconolactone decarboxylase family protein [Clostridia bacterium]MCI2015226.1 carboxymuconolactone decarboxylase family protein [Clostridia bacterium]